MDTDYISQCKYYLLIVTSNVTGRHRGPKRAGVVCGANFLQILLILSYVAPPSERYYNTLLCDTLLCKRCHIFHRRV